MNYENLYKYPQVTFDLCIDPCLPSDLPTGSYIQEDLSRCSSLCEAGSDCCDIMASCKCGTHTGQYDCICEKGHYGKGLQQECTGLSQPGRTGRIEGGGERERGKTRERDTVPSESIQTP
uniref:Uncharacterized protein n=1 Tax=Hucho hucho TaxID=62062 RepID=A0A4W5MLD8_9TELE